MQDIQLMKYVPINISCTKNVNIQRHYDKDART